MLSSKVGVDEYRLLSMVVDSEGDRAYILFEGELTVAI